MQGHRSSDSDLERGVQEANCYSKDPQGVELDPPARGGVDTRWDLKIRDERPRADYDDVPRVT